MKRPLLAKDLQKTCEFIVEYSDKVRTCVQMTLHFYIIDVELDRCMYIDCVVFMI